MMYEKIRNNSRTPCIRGEECIPLSLYRNVCLRRDDVTLSYIVRQQTDNYRILRIIGVTAARPFAQERYE